MNSRPNEVIHNNNNESKAESEAKESNVSDSNQIIAATLIEELICKQLKILNDTKNFISSMFISVQDRAKNIITQLNNFRDALYSKQELSHLTLITIAQFDRKDLGYPIIKSFLEKGLPLQCLEPIIVDPETKLMLEEFCTSLQPHPIGSASL